MNTQSLVEHLRGSAFGLIIGMIVLEITEYSADIAGKVAFAGLLLLVVSTQCLIWIKKHRRTQNDE